MSNLENELIVYLPKLINGIREIAALLHSGKTSEALDSLNLIIDGIDWTIKGLAESFKNFEEDISRTNMILGEINKALNNNNYVLVADLFEYELVALLEQISQSINN